MKFFLHLFVVAPCTLIVLRPLFVQLTHTNYYKTVKELKSFKIIIVTSTYFGLHELFRELSACASLKLQCWLRSHIIIWSYRYCGCIFFSVLLCVWIVHCTYWNSSFTSLPNKGSRGRRIRALARLQVRRQRSKIWLPLGSEQIGNSNQPASHPIGGLMEGFSLTVKGLCM
jgi:hypothetical protein